jgi:glutaredoxin
MRKKTILKSIFLCGFIGLLYFLGILLTSKVPVECYLYDPCGGCFTDQGPCKPCEVEKKSNSEYQGLIAQSNLTKTVDFKLYNVLYKFYEQKYEVKLKQFNISNPGRAFPIVFIGNKYLIGEKEIQEKLISTINYAKNPFYKLASFLKHKDSTAEETNNISFVELGKNNIIYFSVTDCEDCKRVEKKLPELKHQNFKNNDFQIISYKINDKQNLNLLNSYYQEYNIKGEIVVPTIFVGNKHLSGYEEINKYLKKYLINGDGFNTEIIRDDSND